MRSSIASSNARSTGGERRNWSRRTVSVGSANASHGSQGRMVSSFQPTLRPGRGLSARAGGIASPSWTRQRDLPDARWRGLLRERGSPSLRIRRIALEALGQIFRQAWSTLQRVVDRLLSAERKSCPEKARVTASALEALQRFRPQQNDPGADAHPQRRSCGSGGAFLKLRRHPDALPHGGSSR